MTTQEFRSVHGASWRGQDRTAFRGVMTGILHLWSAGIGRQGETCRRRLTYYKILSPDPRLFPTRESHLGGIQSP